MNQKICLSAYKWMCFFFDKIITQSMYTHVTGNPQLTLSSFEEVPNVCTAELKIMIYQIEILTASKYLHKGISFVNTLFGSLTTLLQNAKTIQRS